MAWKCVSKTKAGKKCKRAVSRKGGKCASHKGKKTSKKKAKKKTTKRGTKKSSAKKASRKKATGKRRCKAILVSGKRCKCYCKGSSGVYCASHSGGKGKRKKAKKNPAFSHLKTGKPNMPANWKL